MSDMKSIWSELFHFACNTSDPVIGTSKQIPIFPFRRHLLVIWNAALILRFLVNSLQAQLISYLSSLPSRVMVTNSLSKVINFPGSKLDASDMWANAVAKVSIDSFYSVNKDSIKGVDGQEKANSSIRNRKLETWWQPCFQIYLNPL